MIETAGLAILFAWLIFAALLTVLALLVLRPPADPLDEDTHPPDEKASPN